MSPGEAIRSVLHNYARFNGRASRSEYWWWVLAYVVLYAIVSMAAVAARTPAIIALFGIIALVLVIPTLAVWVRRLHDVGRSGWWWLISVIPFGAFVLLIFTILDSQNGPNRWGPPPYGSTYYDTGPGSGWGAPPPQAPPPGWGAPPPQAPPPGWGAPPPQQPGWGSPPTQAQSPQNWAPPQAQSPQNWAPPPQQPGWGAPPPQGQPPQGQPPQAWGPPPAQAPGWVPPQGPGPNDPRAQ